MSTVSVRVVPAGRVHETVNVRVCTVSVAYHSGNCTPFGPRRTCTGWFWPSSMVIRSSWLLGQLTAPITQPALAEPSVQAPMTKNDKSPTSAAMRAGSILPLGMTRHLPPGSAFSRTGVAPAGICAADNGIDSSAVALNVCPCGVAAYTGDSALMPSSAGAPEASRDMRNVVGAANAPEGTISCTPSGPSTTPPAASRVALPIVGAGGGGGAAGSSDPPQATNPRAMPSTSGTHCHRCQFEIRFMSLP
jgi:hypothetical protein